MSSNLQKVAEKGKSVVLQTSGKAPEMSNFTQKCARLSQLLRESGMLGPPAPAKGTAEAAGGATTTMDLLPNIGKSGESSKQNQIVAAAAAAPSLPPRPPPPPTKTTASSSSKPEDFVKQFTKSINNSSDSITRTPAPKGADKTGQMTIFYAGKVWVLDEFPEEKAREIIVLATRGSSNKKPDGLSSPSTDGKLNSESSATLKTSTSNTFSVPKAISTQEKLSHQPQIQGCDMPIARRASLHRFLGKRKERYTAKDPYPDNNNNGNNSTSNNNNNNNNSLKSTRKHGYGWIDLEAEPSNTDKNDSEAEPSKHLDLDLDCTL